MKTVAVIPIKTNNERLPGKNTKLLAGKPLISYCLEQLEQVKEIDEVYVYCSDERIKEYLPASVIFLKRPEQLDLPTSNFNQIFDQFIEQVNAERYVYAHATAPFVTAQTIVECIKATDSDKYDSAFTAIEIQDYLWNDKGPLNFDAQNVPRSQDLDKIYRESSGVYVIMREVYKAIGRRVGEQPYIKPISYKEAIDINTPEDFKLAEIFVNVDFSREVN